VPMTTDPWVSCTVPKTADPVLITLQSIESALTIDTVISDLRIGSEHSLGHLKQDSQLFCIPGVPLQGFGGQGCGVIGSVGGSGTEVLVGAPGVKLGTGVLVEAGPGPSPQHL